MLFLPRSTDVDVNIPYCKFIFHNMNKQKLREREARHSWKTSSDVEEKMVSGDETVNPEVI